jgi:RNA polymerase sigma-70 factor (ECF subfamily)
MNLTDSALVEQVLSGNKDAFEEIVQRHQHRVYYVALSRLRDRYEAEDLAQETFIQAYRKLASYDSRYSFRSWLMTICVNRGKNRLRSLARMNRAYQAHRKVSSGEVQGPDQELVALREAIYQIPEKLRLPLVLKHVEGFSYEEVADIMRISISAAKMRVRRARDALVQNMKPGTRNLEPSIRQGSIS